MSRVNYQNTANPGINGTGLITNGSNLLTASIGALGNTFADRQATIDLKAAEKLKQQQDEADAYVMRQMAAQTTLDGMNAQSNAFLNDSLAKQARAKAFLDAETIKTGKFNQEGIRANTGLTKANTGLVGAQTAGTNARTAGTLLANSIKQYGHDRDVAQHDAENKYYMENYGVNKTDFDARNQAYNASPELNSAESTLVTQNAIKQMNNLKENSLDENGNFSNELYVENVKSYLNTANAREVGALVESGLVSPEAVAGYGHISQNQLSQAIVDANTPRDSRDSIIDAAFNTDSTPINQGTVGDGIGAVTAINPETGEVEVVETTTASPSTGGLLNSTIPTEQVEPTQVADSTTQTTSGYRNDTPNPLVNEIVDIINKGETQSLTGEDRGRLAKLYADTTPEERKAHGLPDEPLKTSPNVVGNITTTMDKSSTNAVKKMGISNYALDSLVKDGVIPSDTQWTPQVAEKVIDEIIKSQGGAESAKRLLGDTVLKSAYSNHPELRNTYSEATHDNFVKTLGNELYEAVQGTTNRRNPTPTAVEPSVASLPQEAKRGYLQEAAAIQEQGGTLTPQQETNVAQLQREEVENNKTLMSSNVKEVGNIMRNVKSPEDLEASIEPMEQTVNALLNSQGAKLADIEYTQLRMADYTPSNYTNKNDTLSGFLESNKDLYKEEDKDIVYRSADRAYEALRAMDVPVQFIYPILKDSIGEKGTVVKENVERQGQLVKNAWVKNKVANNNLLTERDNIKKNMEELSVAWSNIKTLSTERFNPRQIIHKNRWDTTFSDAIKPFGKALLKSNQYYQKSGAN